MTKTVLFTYFERSSYNLCTKSVWFKTVFKILYFHHIAVYQPEGTSIFFGYQPEGTKILLYKTIGSTFWLVSKKNSVTFWLIARDMHI